MKLPSGYIFLLKPDRKGIAVTIEEKELILCGDCKYYCEEKKGRGFCERLFKTYKTETDFCSKAEKQGG